MPWKLPLWLHHSGGGVLWGAMIFVLIAALRPRTWGLVACLAAATGTVVTIEASRLLHTPAVDAFRATLAGQLLLGRIFSAWNFAVDEFGVAGAAGAVWLFSRNDVERGDTAA